MASVDPATANELVGDVEDTLTNWKQYKRWLAETMARRSQTTCIEEEFATFFVFDDGKRCSLDQPFVQSHAAAVSRDAQSWEWVYDHCSVTERIEEHLKQLAAPVVYATRRQSRVSPTVDLTTDGINPPASMVKEGETAKQNLFRGVWESAHPQTPLPGQNEWKGPHPYSRKCLFTQEDFTDRTEIVQNVCGHSYSKKGVMSHLEAREINDQELAKDLTDSAEQRKFRLSCQIADCGAGISPQTLSRNEKLMAKLRIERQSRRARIVASGAAVAVPSGRSRTHPIDLTSSGMRIDLGGPTVLPPIKIESAD